MLPQSESHSITFIHHPGLMGREVTCPCGYSKFVTHGPQIIRTAVEHLRSHGIRPDTFRTAQAPAVAMTLPTL
jgi:hypothetical protein